MMNVRNKSGYLPTVLIKSADSLIIGIDGTGLLMVSDVTDVIV